MYDPRLPPASARVLRQCLLVATPPGFNLLRRLRRRDTAHQGEIGPQPTCCEVGPQPLQGIHGHLVYPVPSLAVQRLIAPPRPIQSALLPRLVQNDAVGEAFFSDQVGSGNFIDDSDDDESTGLESSVSQQRKDDANRVTGWCNGDTVRDGDSLMTEKE